jgi:hypothetical protein
MSDTRIKCDSISGGTLFDLRGITANYGHNNYNNIPQEPDRDPTWSYGSRLPLARYQGHDAPTFNIQGMIDTSFSDPTYNASNRPYINIAWLGSFARCGSHCTLIDDTACAFAGQGSLCIVVDSVDMTRNTQHSYAGSEYIVNYNMKVRETRVDPTTGK